MVLLGDNGPACVGFGDSWSACAPFIADWQLLQASVGPKLLEPLQRHPLDYISQVAD